MNTILSYSNRLITNSNNIFAFNVNTSLILDTYPGAVGAYSIDKLRSAYSGSAIRVRRSSDNTEQNIGFVNNTLDIASLLSFVGASNGLVTTIYDQSGNGYNFTQTTADFQPSIVLSGTLNTKNGKPTIVFDGLSDFMEIPTSTGNLSFLHKTGQSFINVVGYNRIAKDSVILANNYTSSANIGYSLQTLVSRNIANFTTKGVSGQPTVANITNTAPITNDTLFLLNDETDNGNATASQRSKLYVNNGSALTLNASTNALSSANASFNLFLGVAGGGGARMAFFDGGISQVIIYNSNQSSNRVGISNIIRTSFSITLDVDAQAFITATGITDGSQIGGIDILVKDLKSAGIWTKMKAIYPFVGGTANTHKFNLKDPRDLNVAFRLLFYGGITHNSNGITMNGTTGGANTYFNPFLNATNGSLHFSAYSRNRPSRGLPDSDFVPMTTYTPNGWTVLRVTSNTSNNLELFSTSDTAQGIVTASSTSVGYGIGSQTATNLRKYYKNGVLLNTNTTNDTTAYLNANLSLNGSAFAAYSASNYAFATLGDGLTDAEALALYTAVQKYQTTLSRQV